jgi:hypothetical protein
MSEGQSQRSVALSVQHRQEVEVAVAEERERAAVETAATTARLAMAELAAARAEVEAAAAADAAPVAPTALFLPTTTTETTSSSWRGRQRGSRQRNGQPRTPRGAVASALTGADALTVLRAEARAAARIDSDRARKTTLQALRKEWENLASKPGDDVDDFALRLNTLQQKMV